MVVAVVVVREAAVVVVVVATARLNLNTFVRSFFVDCVCDGVCYCFCLLDLRRLLSVKARGAKRHYVNIFALLWLR